MAIILSVLRCPDDAVPETRRLAGGELCIGRDALRSQWVLPDTTQQISRLHCTVRFDGTAWQVQDSSANGTFINQERTALGQGAARTLKDGDRLRVGPYEIEARIDAPARLDAPAWGTMMPPASAGRGGSLFPERNAGADDPFAAHGLPFGGQPQELFGGQPQELFGGQPQGPFGDDPITSSPFADQSISLPADLLAPDPFAPSHAAPPATTPDHTPRFTDAFAPPRPVLSDDWAKEFELNDPVAMRDDARAACDPIETPAANPPPLAQPLRADAAPAGDSALLAAFMAGAGLPDLTPADPVTAMRDAGAAFRAFVTGLRDVLMVRAEMKGAMGIDKTTIRPRGNNPLKFAAGDDDALTALLGTGRRTGMAPMQAVADALRDIRMHEQATLPAMQAAIRALLERLDPEKLRAATEGGIALPAQRRARAFEHFEAEYARLLAALGDDFDAVFGRRFAAEYDRIIADLRAGEPEP